jgi:MOSC domain-containing protein YiiM
MQGKIRQISVSDGGVPKSPVAQASIGLNGVDGDRQRDTKHHGGPQRAVCLFSSEIIEALRLEGHPIEPGSVGENLTVEGVDWGRVAPGTRFVFQGGAELEVTSFTEPCSHIRDAFTNLEFRRIKQDLHPGQSRVYARVLKEGVVRAGENFRVEPADPRGADGRR